MTTGDDDNLANLVKEVPVSHIDPHHPTARLWLIHIFIEYARWQQYTYMQ